MNIKELIEKYEYLNHSYFRRVDTSEVLRDLKQLDEPQKVVVPQFVADWYEINKDNLDKNIVCLFLNWERTINDNDFFKWMSDADDFIQTLVNMHQFGYTVEEEKRYMIKLKGVPDGAKFLKYTKVAREWYFGMRIHCNDIEVSHTRKELEEAGFDWVFDCEGIEIEEVEE